MYIFRFSYSSRCTNICFAVCKTFLVCLMLQHECVWNCQCEGDLTQYIAANWWNPDTMVYVPVPGDIIFCGYATNCR